MYIPAHSAKFVKATDEERIRTLFSTFEMSSYGGITYYEFVKMVRSA